MVLGVRSVFIWCKFFIFPSVDFSKYDKEVLLVLVSFCKTRSVLHDVVYGGMIVVLLCLQIYIQKLHLFLFIYKDSQRITSHSLWIYVLSLGRSSGS